MAEIKTCSRCKKLFSYLGGKRICPECKNNEEKIFDDVKEYIRDNPKANFKQIHQDLGVSPKLLEEFIASGRLVLSSSSPLTLTCQICGESIKRGRVCEKCNTGMINELNGINQKTEQPKKTEVKQTGGMFSRR
ncbi:hypothetical protein AN641_05140 [Candidatus Epulonipiscioides gigas]|nr:hypothetical protein AN641_05140 [Epulopiscium sp. SCG-C07WGA-EpuloA2]